MSFKDYKKNRVTSLDDIVKQAETVTASTKSYEADPDDWYPTTDKAGNAVVVIRFMPAPENEEAHFVRWWHHSFQEPSTGMWYIENCLSTLDPSFSGKVDDPVMLYNQKLYRKAGKDADEKHPLRVQASRQKRNINFRSNVYVVADSHKPESNGMLKKWKYGQGVFNELMKAMKPPVIEGAIEQEEPINPFDLIEGANLKIIITTDPTKKVNGKPVRKYEYKWLKKGPLGSDEMMESVWNELNGDKKWSLAQYIAPEKFKTFEELHKRLVKVMGFDPFKDAVFSVSVPSTKPQEPIREDQPKAPKEDSPPLNEPVAAPASAPETDDWFAQLESNE